MKLYTDTELIAQGLRIMEARRKGGETIYKRFGKEYYSKLGKKSQALKKAKKEALKLDS